MDGRKDSGVPRVAFPVCWTTGRRTSDEPPHQPLDECSHETREKDKGGGGEREDEVADGWMIVGRDVRDGNATGRKNDRDSRCLVS